MLFMSGCFLRCQYCHNPDTWHLKDGTKIELSHAIRRLRDFAPALRAMGGGLTISGGEPLVQIGFTRGLFSAANAMGLHTALDTSGFLGHRADDEPSRARERGRAGHCQARDRKPVPDARAARAAGASAHGGG
jgi:pyruvate formate lyase activating enzyme